jgi:hypothetical protein
MTPPEVILDRWVKKISCTHPPFRGYVGKLDIEKLASPPLRQFLHVVQEVMNRALASENVNASGGVKHPPFHFDYLEVADGTRNAHAFQHDGFSFVAITLPLIELLWELSHRLSTSADVRGMLCFDQGAMPLEVLRALFFQVQLSFLVSHEYTHHVHQLCGHDDSSMAEVWTEFSRKEGNAGLDSQARELDADGYAIYLSLAHFIRGEGRQSSLAQLGRQDLRGTEADELLLTCFFLSVTAVFCAFWPDDIQVSSIGQLSHPPAPVRIEYAIRVAKMWCGQSESVPSEWFDSQRFQALFETAAKVIGGSERQIWDAHLAFFLSEDGKKYDRQLLQRFESMRRSRDESAQCAQT